MSENMRSTTHKISSICLILAGYKAIHAHGGELSMFFFMLGGIVGARSPDWLEVARWKTRGWLWWKQAFRESWIPHRTITHWMLAWVVAVAVSTLSFISTGTPGTALFLGFTASGLLHVFADWLTPMGVPFLLPWKRHSLKLIHGLRGEIVFIVGLFGIVLFLAHSSL